MTDTTTIEIRQHGTIKTIENVLAASNAAKDGQEGIVVTTDTNSTDFYPNASFSGVGENDFPDEYTLVA